MTSRRYLVSGMVQGVGFRWWARTRATELRLVGWARNLSDGRVEVVAQGGETALSELERSLQHGPPYARVTGVEKIEIQDEVDDCIFFDIR